MPTPEEKLEQDRLRWIHRLEVLKRFLEKKLATLEGMGAPLDVPKDAEGEISTLILHIQRLSDEDLQQVLVNLQQLWDKYDLGHKKQSKEILAKLSTNTVVADLKAMNTHIMHIRMRDLKWQTEDPKYSTLLSKPVKFKPKEGGAKNKGLRTAVYTFEDSANKEKETMLIKLGADVGETIAEFMGACLYQATIPDHAANCILVRDGSISQPTIDDIYVASIYPKGEDVQDAFKAVGEKKRGWFAGLRARFARESLVRKVIHMDQTQADNSLAICAANVIFHGDHDCHTGNFVTVKYKKFENGKEHKKVKFFKIDHGFSFFNFTKKVVNIFDPFAGKVVDVNFKRYMRGGKLLEFYPTNHFWDFAVEDKGFYYNAPFIKACEDIAMLPEATIRDKIKTGLDQVTRTYGFHSNEALRKFGERIGMTESQLTAPLGKDPVVYLRSTIETHMVTHLVARQKSMQEIADQCRQQTRYRDKSRSHLSESLGKQIIVCLDKLKLETANASGRKPSQTEIIPGFQSLARGNDNLIKNYQAMLSKELIFLKMLQQANDIGLLGLSHDFQFQVSSEFYFYHDGTREKIAPEEFATLVKGIFPAKDVEQHIGPKGVKAPQMLMRNLSPEAFKEAIEHKVPLSEESLTLLSDLKQRLAVETKKSLRNKK